MEEALDRGAFTEGQLIELQELDRRGDEREKEILKIAQSVNDLASIFRELSVLVIEQGTILDRIDYNIEQTLVKVKSGGEELVKADKYSKKAGRRKCFCILFLMITVVVESLILMSRHGVFKRH
jgi:syntaxin 16